MKTALALVAVLAASPIPLTSEPITFVGIGNVKVGSLVSAVESKLKLKDADLSTSDAGCRQYEVGGDDSLLAMAEDGIVTRVETWNRRYRTASGARVGDSEASVQRLYGHRLEVSEHQYDPAGHYFTIRSKDQKFALVLETDGKRVTSIRAGRFPSAEYVEGCV